MSAQKKLTIVFAVTLTTLAVAMAAIAAMDRGGSFADKLLLVALASLVAGLVHLLPALTKNKLAWILWAGCFLATVYGHLTFFTNAQSRAGEIRAQNSMVASDIEKQILTVTRERDSIVSRPVTVVMRDLAATQDWKAKQVLRNELAEARRSITLTEQLIALNEEAKKSHVTQSNDRVTALLSGVTGGNGAEISLGIGLFFAILIDVAGAVLWREVFASCDSKLEPVTVPVALTPPDLVKIEGEELPESEVTEKTFQDLQAAIKAGICKPTVSAIRAFMGCGQAKACELRKQLSLENL